MFSFSNRREHCPLCGYKTEDISICYLLPHALESYANIPELKIIRKLFNYGEAFYYQDNNEWKDYRISVLPTTQSDIGSIQRLMKFISLHRSKLTMEVENNNAIHYPVCGSKHISNIGENTCKCNDSDCGIEWGRTRCTQGCQEYFHWIRPDGIFEKEDFDGLEPYEYVLKKDSIFDRYIITDFEFDAIDDKYLKAIPVCPKCGKRRFDNA